MKITKNKLAAASFGAALASLYSAPELCAQSVDSNPGTLGFSFVPGTVPLFEGVQTLGNPSEAVLNGATSGFYGSVVDFGFFNDGIYGAGINGASTFWVLEPGDVFDGYTDGGVNLLAFSPSETGVRTIGFVALGEVGYFRIDLGQPGDALILLDGELAVSADGDPFNNDFVITIPDSDVTPPPLLGDVNLDGMVNFLDISPFINRLSNGIFQAEADIDGNGEVNFLDISPFIQVLSGGSSLQVSWSDSTGKPIERSVAGNEAIEQQLQAVELKLKNELITALAQSSNSSSALTNEPESASVGLASLAFGAAGLRRRRKTATTVA